MKRIFVLVVLFWSSLSWSEYRAYQLVITNKESGTEKRVLSTLDHLQYKYFYSVGANESIFYEDSWMCYGNTSYHKPICKPPQKNGISNDPSKG